METCFPRQSIRVEQLTGRADARQVAGAQLALTHGNGGELSSQATLVLGTAETL